MSLIKNAPGLFTFDTVATSGVYNSGNDIPIQTLNLESIRVEFNASTDALTAKLIYIEFPWVSTNHVIDGNPTRNYIPILLDNAAVTKSVGLSQPIYMSAHIPPSFQYRIYDSTFAAPTNFVRLTMIFTTTLSSS
jgi:hypothetical protein